MYMLAEASKKYRNDMVFLFTFLFPKGHSNGSTDEIVPSSTHWHAFS